MAMLSMRHGEKLARERVHNEKIIEQVTETCSYSILHKSGACSSSLPFVTGMVVDLWLAHPCSICGAYAIMEHSTYSALLEAKRICFVRNHQIKLILNFGECDKGDCHDCN